MCGIAGFWGAGDQAIVTAMTDALAHRGPDGYGYHVDEGNRIFLGHRRLAIIDIGGGAQPMWNEDQTVGVVFNVIRKVNKSLSYVTTGQDVPDDIEVGRGKRLAQLILGGKL